MTKILIALMLTATPAVAKDWGAQAPSSFRGSAIRGEYKGNHFSGFIHMHGNDYAASGRLGTKGHFHTFTINMGKLGPK